MGSKSPTLHLQAVVLLIPAAIFAWDSGQKGLWASFALGVTICALLLAIVIATRQGAFAMAPEPPAPAPSDPHGLHLLLDQVPIPLVSYSEEKGVQAVNRAARSLFQTDGDIVLESHDLIRSMTGLLSAGRPTVRILGRQYAVSVSEILSADSHIRLATLTDVQMEIHKAEAAALRDTLHILSHEIMNSLTPVSSLADIADSYLADETRPSIPSAREALDTLSRRAKSLTRFIESYRLVARLPEPALQPIDPAPLIRDIVDFFAHSADTQDVDFQLELADTLPRLNLDEAQISQAIINVITNAVEATQDNADGRRVTIDVTSSPRGLTIRIGDNGPGISDAITANLFTAFATTKAKGSGTGLNLARQIVLAHGGNLELLNNGHVDDTIFAFTLPLPS